MIITTLWVCVEATICNDLDILLNIAGCRFGDRLEESVCANISQEMCYDSSIQQECCYTCHNEKMEIPTQGI